MITTSTPALNFTGKKTSEASEERLPDFASPSVKTLEAILNYSKNLEIKKSKFVTEIEIIRS